MGVKTFTAVFLVSLLLGLLIWLPASMITRQLQLPDDVSLQQVDGTLWQGGAQLTLMQQPLEVRWQHLGWGSMAKWQVQLLAPGVRVQGDLNLRALAIEDWNGRVHSSFVNALLQNHPMTTGTQLNGELELRALWLVGNWSLQPLSASGRIISSADRLSHTFFGAPQQLNIPPSEWYLSDTDNEPGINVQMVDAELELLLVANLYADRSFDYQVQRRLPEAVGLPVSGSGEVVAAAVRGEPLF